MAVLIDMITLIVKVSPLEEKYPGGTMRLNIEHPGSYACDGTLARVTFMSGNDSGDCVEKLERSRLVYDHNGTAQDMIVTDMMRGACYRCDWLEVHLDRHSQGRFPFSYGWLKGTDPFPVAMPGDDCYRRMFPYPDKIMETPYMDNRFQFLQKENGFDVFMDNMIHQKIRLREKPPE